MALPNLNTLDAIGRAQALIKRPDLALEDTDVPAMDIGAAAAMGDYVVGETAREVHGFFNPRGAILTARASAAGVPRKPASKSYGQVTLTRTDTSTNEDVPVGGVVLETEPDADGLVVQFTNTQALNRLIGVAAITVNVECLATGPDGDVDPGAIVVVRSGLTGNTCTNAERLAGGNNEESDEQLLGRWGAKPASDQKGTPAALVFGALRVSGVAVASAVVTGTGLTNVYVADAQGNSSALMTAAVAAELETGGDLAKGWASAGSAYQVIGAVALVQNVTMSLSLRAGSSASATALQPLIEAACQARAELLQPGETMTHDLLKSAAMSVDKDILGVTISIPAGAVVPTASQKIRVGTVAVS